MSYACGPCQSDIKELDQFRPLATLGDGVVPHNVHVFNDYLIISYYTDGVLIVDGSSDTPIGLAGVKGGSFAGVHEGTSQVIIETAHFHPTITTNGHANNLDRPRLAYRINNFQPSHTGRQLPPHNT